MVYQLGRNVIQNVIAMNSFLLYYMMLICGLPSGSLQTQFDSIPRYNSPTVYPELEPNTLILSLVFDTATVSRSANTLELDTFSQHILNIQRRKQEKNLTYYEQEHLRLEGMLRAKNTDKKIQISSYSSIARRNGDNKIGLVWEITGFSSGLLISDHLQDVLSSTLDVIQWYADIHQRTIDWSDIRFRLNVTSTLVTELSTLAPSAYYLEVKSSDLPANQVFLLTVEAPLFFKEAYDEYLNESARIDRETRRQLKQHR